ncbi:TadE/TadG family type IV pilus assembly protein [Vibrio neonatus]|uniref:TadE/TadG family type IV pilus assembly protein n=1 Tax=Vibrio neonatus TaxID=278860 RepID=UPI0021C4B61B|nr:pilus assembly protein [Vibrio neonatus]
MSAQRGHAGILFAIMIPFIMSIFVWGIEGGRAIQTKARLNDAVEVATYAVAAHNSDDNSVNDELVKHYLRAYIPDYQDVHLHVTKIACEKNPACTQNLARNHDAKRFFEYRVNAKINQKAWFTNPTFVDMGKDYDVASEDSARKYQSQAVDVVFAADFSTSMGNRLKSTCPNGRCSHSHPGQAKYKMVIEIIKEITDELQKFNNNLANNQKNKVAFTAYDNYVQQLTHQYYPSRYYYQKEGSSNHYSFDRHGRANTCYQSFQYGGNQSSHSISQTVAIHTIQHIFDMSHWGGDASKNYRCIYSVSSSLSNASFHNVPITDNFSAFNNGIKNFKPKGGTASYVGLIRAAQLAASPQADEPRRLIILLSDGQDSHPNITSMLAHPGYNHIGLCDKIREHFNNPSSTSHWTSEHKEVKARLAVIGFDYPVNSNTGLRDCVGKDNIYTAEDKDAIKDKILELISEEIGHLN